MTAFEAVYLIQKIIEHTFLRVTNYHNIAYNKCLKVKTENFNNTFRTSGHYKSSKSFFSIAANDQSLIQLSTISIWRLL